MKGVGSRTEGYDATTYGQSIADVYDDWHSGVNSEQIELLCHLAGGGPVLELGAGTDRLALPLASRGVQVHCIDTSQAMLAKLPAKPGGDRVITTVGDFANFGLAERFSLVFVAFNTFSPCPTRRPNSPVSLPYLATSHPAAGFSWRLSSPTPPASTGASE